MPKNFVRFLFRWLPGGPRPDEFQSAHGAKSTHIANQRPALFPFACTGVKPSSDLFRARRQIIALQSFDNRKRGGTRERVAAIGTAQTADARSVHDFRASGDGSERQSVRNRFRADKDVRSNSISLTRKHGAGAAETCLHFIGDEQNLVAATDVLDDCEKLRGRCNEPTFAEDGLYTRGRHGWLSHDAFDSAFQMVAIA